MTPEELHALALAKVVDRLKAHAGVKALAADRVGPEAGDLPCVVVTLGKRHESPDATAPVLTQMDVRVECRAADPAVRDLLLVASQKALNGQVMSPADGIFQAVLSHTGRPDEDDGVHHRRDVYGVFVRQRPNDAQPVASGGGSFADPARLAAENEALRRRVAELESKPVPASER